MSLTFPSSPSLNQETTTGGRTYRWNGEAWELAGSGIAGPTGATGAAGAASTVTGPTGATGSVGAGVALLGSVATFGDLPGSGNTVGDSYVVAADGHLYVWDGAAWDDVGNIVGPTGPTGAASTVTGPTGAASNVTGPVGATGASVTGPTGAASTVTGPTGPSAGSAIGLILALA